MSAKTIQHYLGHGVVEMLNDFIAADIPTVEELRADLFAHMTNAQLQKKAAAIFYGARWIYKAGLVTLSAGSARTGVLRAQIIDFSALLELLLADAIAFGLINDSMRGIQYSQAKVPALSPSASTPKIPWKADPWKQLGARNLNWMITVAVEEKIIPKTLGERLHALRKDRNAVHPLRMGNSFRPDVAKDALTCVTKAAKKCAAWKRSI